MSEFTHEDTGGFQTERIEADDNNEPASKKVMLNTDAVRQAKMWKITIAYQ